MSPITSNDLLFDEGKVKIVLNHNNEALYFSRLPIPCLRGVPQAEWHNRHNYYRHIGLYAYRKDILQQITELSPSYLEKAESLEQLRWLEAGYKIKCVLTRFDSHSIDTPDDVIQVLQLLNAKLH